MTQIARLERRARKDEMDIQRKKGNLNESEIQEYLGFEFGEEPMGIKNQLRRYFLKLKTDDPEQAAEFLAELPVLIEKDILLTEAEVVAFCQILRKYFSGFALYFNGRTHTKDSKIVPHLSGV